LVGDLGDVGDVGDVGDFGDAGDFGDFDDVGDVGDAGDAGAPVDADGLSPGPAPGIVASGVVAAAGLRTVDVVVAPSAAVEAPLG
jgi:hypothetical protein